VPESRRRQVLKIKRSGEFLFFLSLTVLFQLLVNWMPAHISERDFIQSIHSNGNLFWELLRNPILLAIWTSLTWSSPHIKLSITASNIIHQVSMIYLPPIGSAS
jgi:hypothetical protein